MMEQSTIYERHGGTSLRQVELSGEGEPWKMEKKKLSDVKVTGHINMYVIDRRQVKSDVRLFVCLPDRQVAASLILVCVTRPR